MVSPPSSATCPNSPPANTSTCKVAGIPIPNTDSNSTPRSANKRSPTIIEESPEKLRDVPCIGADRTAKINAAWQAQKQVKEIMLFLHGHGVSTNLATKIYKTHGDSALNTIQANPYQLERDIYGVGFKTADKVAQKLCVLTGSKRAIGMSVGNNKVARRFSALDRRLK